MSPDPPEPPVVDPLVEVGVPPPVLVPPPSFRIPANQDSNQLDQRPGRDHQHKQHRQ